MRDNDNMTANNSASSNPCSVSRDFKGIWIPREIWLCPELSAIEKLVWAEVHSLYDRELGGCYASNEYLAKFFGMSERYIREVLSKLKSLGLMVEVSFDGRQRVIAAIEPDQDFGKNSIAGSGQTGTTVPGRREPQFRSRRNHSSGPSYIEKKGNSKEDIPSTKVAQQTANAAAPPAKKLGGGSAKIALGVSAKPAKPGKIAFRDGVFLHQAEYDRLLGEVGQEQLDWMLDKLSSHNVSRGKSYPSDAGPMNKAGWAREAYSARKQSDHSNVAYHRKNSKLAFQTTKDDWTPTPIEPSTLSADQRAAIMEELRFKS